DVDAVGAGVLRDDQQLLHARLHQALGFAHDVADGAADQIAAHGRNDAEAAAVVAAFGNLQVGVMPRRELDPLRRHEVDVGIVVAFGRGGFVHGAHHLFLLLGAGDGQHRGVDLADEVFLDAHAAGDDHFAVFGDGLTDGFE